MRREHNNDATGARETTEGGTKESGVEERGGEKLANAMATPTTFLEKVLTIVREKTDHNIASIAIFISAIGLVGTIEYMTHIIITIEQIIVLETTPSIAAGLREAMRSSAPWRQTLQYWMVELINIGMVGSLLTAAVVTAGLHNHEHVSKEQMSAILTTDESQGVTMKSRSQNMNENEWEEITRLLNDDRVQLQPDTADYSLLNAGESVDDVRILTLSVGVIGNDVFEEYVARNTVEELTVEDSDKGLPTVSWIDTLADIDHEAHLQIVTRGSLLGQSHQEQYRALNQDAYQEWKSTPSDSTEDKWLLANVRAAVVIRGDEEDVAKEVRKSLKSLSTPIAESFQRSNIVSVKIGDSESLNPLKRRRAQRIRTAIENVKFVYRPPSLLNVYLPFPLPRPSIPMPSDVVGGFLVMPSDPPPGVAKEIDSQSPDQAPPEQTTPDRDDPSKTDAYDPQRTANDGEPSSADDHQDSGDTDMEDGSEEKDR